MKSRFTVNSEQLPGERRWWFIVEHFPDDPGGKRRTHYHYGSYSRKVVERRCAELNESFEKGKLVNG